MGKAKIVSGGTEGHYTIALDYGKEQRDKRVTALQKRLAQLAPELDKKQGDVGQAQVKQAGKAIAAEQAIEDYVEATQQAAQANKALLLAGQQLEAVATSSIATPAEIQAAQAAVKGAEAAVSAAQAAAKEAQEAQTKSAKELQEAKGDVAKAKLAFDLLQEEKERISKEMAYLTGLQLDESRQVWCADLTEDATGDVATLEIPGESGLILIKPGAPAANTVDGALFAREMQSPEQVFWNAAVLPGWQKWKPMYRRGTIAALDKENDTADVTLIDDRSSAQNLKINQTGTLSAVPVVYMTCNTEAFEVGDECVVRFDDMDWKKPKVIGFVTNPKSCLFSGIGLVLGDYIPRVLQPPASLIGAGEWKLKTVDELNGGPFYAFVGGKSFTESGSIPLNNFTFYKTGLFSGNKLAANYAIYGASGTSIQNTPHLFANNYFNVSGLFISKGAIKQLKVSGSNLLRGGWEIKKLPQQEGSDAGKLEEQIYQLPDAGTGQAWGMVSAAQDGSKFSVCRMKGEVVVAVAHFSEDDNGLLLLDYVQDIDEQATIQSPNADVEYKAPDYASFTWVLTVAPRRSDGSGGQITVDYSEASHYEGSQIYRHYIGHDGIVRIDTAIRSRHTSANCYYREFLVNDVPDAESRYSASCSETEDLVFNGTQRIKTLDLTVSHSAPNANRDMATSVSIERAIVLLVDEQFSVVMALRGQINYSYSGNTNIFPAQESSSLSASTPVLEIWHHGNLTSIILPNNNFSPGQAKSSLNSYARNAYFGGNKGLNVGKGLYVVSTSGTPFKIFTPEDGGTATGFVASGFLIEYGLKYWFDIKQQGEDGLLAVDNAQYAKDPKTGVGFFSFSFGGVVKNWIIGPWGVESSDSKTSIASDAEVKALMSV